MEKYCSWFFFCLFHSVCNCDSEGVARDICDPNTGSCICMVNFAGPRCDVCNAGYYRFPTCDGRFLRLYFDCFHFEQNVQLIDK